MFHSKRVVLIWEQVRMKACQAADLSANTNIILFIYIYRVRHLNAWQTKPTFRKWSYFCYSCLTCLLTKPKFKKYELIKVFLSVFTVKILSLSFLLMHPAYYFFGTYPDWHSRWREFLFILKNCPCCSSRDLEVPNCQNVNPLVPRVQKMKIRNLALNRLLIVEFVRKMVYLGAHYSERQGLMG